MSNLLIVFTLMMLPSVFMLASSMVVSFLESKKSSTVRQRC